MEMEFQRNYRKIFLPFYSTKKRGSGIGLFLVKRIIDDHEGTIALESQEGVTTAQIILPFLILQYEKNSYY